MNDQKLDISNWKKTVDSHLKQIGLITHIQDLILELRKRKGDLNSEIISEEVLCRLKEEGILDDVVQSISKESVCNFPNSNKPITQSGQQRVQLDSSENNESCEINFPAMTVTELKTEAETYDKASCKLHNVLKEQPSESENASPSRPTTQLILEIKRGKAFLDFLLDESENRKKQFSRLILCIYFCGQRYWSKPVLGTCDPGFNEIFSFNMVRKKLHNESFGSGDLLGISDAMHFVLIEVNPMGSRKLLASHYLDWREVLVSEGSKKYLSLEMMGIETHTKRSYLTLTIAGWFRIHHCCQKATNSSGKSMKYILNYVHKGSDMTVFAVQHINDKDEITRYQMGRYISSNEAVWRILSFQIHERDPAVCPSILLK